MRRWAVLLVLLMLGATGLARGDTPSVLRDSLQVARSYWQAIPACGLPTVIQVDDQATVDPSGPDVLLGYADPNACLIHVETTAVLALYGTPGLGDSPRLYARALCRLIVHEYGHELGYGHTLDRSKVMYPGLVNPDHFAPCVAAFPVRNRAPRRRGAGSTR